ncbi:hypothetical protein LTS18_015085, partial [Coniosporium uncinatum]
TTGLRPKAPEIAQNTGWKAAEQRTKDVWKISVSLHGTMVVICVFQRWHRLCVNLAGGGCCLMKAKKIYSQARER